MNANDKPQGPSLDIELNEEIAEGTYSNFAIITHSQSEFVLDFFRMMPGVPKGKVKSRIVLAPQHAKRLLMALGENVHKYEEHFGDINIDEMAPMPNTVPFSFGGQTGQA